MIGPEFAAAVFAREVAIIFAVALALIGIAFVAGAGTFAILSAVFG